LRVLSERIAKSAQVWDDAIHAAVSSVSYRAFAIIALALSVLFSPFPVMVHRVSVVVAAILITIVVTRALRRAVDVLVGTLRNDEQSHGMRGALTVLGSVASLMIWVVAALTVVAYFGVNVTSLLAGLGIGGIAVALAIQGILKDLFASFSIFFDQPFTIGDYVKVGDGAISGTVQRIGIKTTRLRAFSGEEVVVPNQDITAATLRNFKRMESRRVTQRIGVVYETDAEILERIPEIVASVINSVPSAEHQRTHFRSFDDWALVFETVYTVPTRDYTTYLNVQHAVNIGLVRAFANHGIMMAYPTQTVYHAPITQSS